eukprot:7091511-Alexandrium_andersonii.AAC.1
MLIAPFRSSSMTPVNALAPKRQQQNNRSQLHDCSNLLSSIAAQGMGHSREGRKQLAAVLP